MLAAFVGLGRVTETVDERPPPLVNVLTSRRDAYHKRRLWQDDSGDSQKSLDSSDQDAVLQRRKRHQNKQISNYGAPDRVFETSVSKAVDVIFEKLWKKHRKSIEIAWSESMNNVGIGITFEDFKERVRLSDTTQDGPKEPVLPDSSSDRDSMMWRIARKIFFFGNSEIELVNVDSKYHEPCVLQDVEQKECMNLTPPIYTDTRHLVIPNPQAPRSPDAAEDLITFDGYAMVSIITAGHCAQSVVKLKCAEQVIRSALLCPAFRKAHGWSYVRSEHLLLKEDYHRDESSSDEDEIGSAPPDWMVGMYRPRPCDPRTVRIQGDDSRDNSSDGSSAAQSRRSRSKQQTKARKQTDEKSRAPKARKIQITEAPETVGAAWTGNLPTITEGVDTDEYDSPPFLANQQDEDIGHYYTASARAEYCETVIPGERKNEFPESESTKGSKEGTTSDTTGGTTDCFDDSVFSSNMSSSSLGFLSSEKTGLTLLLSQGGQEAPLEQVPVAGERQLPISSLQQINHLVDPTRELLDGELVSFLTLGVDTPMFMVRQDMILIALGRCRLIILPGAVISLFVGNSQSITDDDPEMQSYLREVKSLRFTMFYHARSIFRERIGRDFGVAYSLSRRHFDLYAQKNPAVMRTARAPRTMMPFRPSMPLSVLVIRHLFDNRASSAAERLNEIVIDRKCILNRVEGAILDHKNSHSWWPRAALNSVQRLNEVRTLFKLYDGGNYTYEVVKVRVRQWNEFSGIVCNLVTVIEGLSQYGYKRGRGIGVFLPNQDIAMDLREWTQLAMRTRRIAGGQLDMIANVQLMNNSYYRYSSLWDQISDSGVVMIETAFMLFAAISSVPCIVASVYGMNLSNGYESIQPETDDVTSLILINHLLTPFHLFCYILTALSFVGFIWSMHKIGTPAYIFAPVWKAAV